MSFLGEPITHSRRRRVMMQQKLLWRNKKYPKLKEKGDLLGVEECEFIIMIFLAFNRNH